MSAIKVAMAYSFGAPVWNGSIPSKGLYYFFMRAIPRNKRLDIAHLDITGGRRFWKSDLKQYDVVLLPGINLAASLALPGLKGSNIPVLAHPGDPHLALISDSVGLADSLKVDRFFDLYGPETFYEYYPRRFRYEVVHIGLEPSLHASVAPWAGRVLDKIALSGMLDKPDIAHKAYYRLYLKRPKEMSADYHYRLRTKCGRLPYVVHTRDVYPGQGTDQLHGVLSLFRAAIAATTTFPTMKYKETPAAGCLTFMEITKRNHGAFLGYEDGRSAVFIDESNYKKKLQEYVDSPDDPRWEGIASAGRRHALENLSNDAGVETLVKIMRELLGE